jgi:hypothetical protein
MGRITEIRVNVTTAFTGTGGTLLVRVMDMPVTNGGATESRYEPVIDLSTAGERVITPSGVTGSGGSDSGLTLPTDAWAVGSAFAGFNAFRNVTGQVGVGPAVTVTIITDQEAVDVADTDYDALLAIAEEGEEPPVVPEITLRSRVVWIDYRN